MIIKLLQLNIQKGRFLNHIIDYVTKEQFDICTFQEVTGGIASDDKRTDIYKILTQNLGLQSVLTVNFSQKEDPNSYYGNGTFYNQELTLSKKEVIRFKPFDLVKNLRNGDPGWEFNPYSALSLQLKENNAIFFIINTHGAWSPRAEDTPEKVRQGQVLFDYLKKLDKPFILAGDFNLTKDTKVIKKYESIATNLTRKFNIINTLNPRLHYAKELFPKGIAVDHVFVSPDIKVKMLKVIDDIDLSDHYGLVCEFEL